MTFCPQRFIYFIKLNSNVFLKEKAALDLSQLMAEDNAAIFDEEMTRIDCYGERPRTLTANGQK